MKNLDNFENFIKAIQDYFQTALENQAWNTEKQDFSHGINTSSEEYVLLSATEHHLKQYLEHTNKAES